MIAIFKLFYNTIAAVGPLLSKLCPKKLWSRSLAITLSNLNRFQKFLHCCKEKKISNKPCVITHGLLEISHHTLDMLLHYLVKYNNSKLTNYTRNTIKNVLIFKFDTIGIVARSTSY